MKDEIGEKGEIGTKLCLFESKLMLAECVGKLA